MEEDLKELLELAYSKGQAYYRLDSYGSHEDCQQDWDHYDEPEYLELIAQFIEKYGR